MGEDISLCALFCFFEKADSEVVFSVQGVAFGVPLESTPVKGRKGIRNEPRRWLNCDRRLTIASSTHSTKNLGAEIVHKSCLVGARRASLLSFCLDQSLDVAALGGLGA